MKEVDRKKVPNKTTLRKTPAKPEKRDPNLQIKSNRKVLKVEDAKVKASSAKGNTAVVVSDSNTGSESSEVFEDVLIDDVDEIPRPDEAAPSDTKTLQISEKEANATPSDHTHDTNHEPTENLGEESETDTNSGSMSSQVDLAAADDVLKPVADSSETADKPIEDVKDDDVVQNETSEIENVVESNDEAGKENSEGEPDAASYQKIQDMELRIEKLEEELREVAALEVALYSVVPEHGSSAHKVHTPARRLCRLYIHASKHWSPQKRATIARNTVSGLILVAKSCGHDVPRLSFWMSNVVALREIISETFPSSCQSGPLLSSVECNGGGNKNEVRSLSMNSKRISGSKLPKKTSFIQLADDWQETRTFTDALQKVESWIFSRMVESIWWQALTPHMQSPSSNGRKTKVVGKMLGPTLGDHRQGSFSIDLWSNAFEDSLRRLCPVRAEGHECGCLPMIARKVMDQCLARLDVAMFNAILRESAHEIPTDPVSDPIVDSRVLPIPAGDLSFGSGAQLKNTVGNWSRCLDELFGTGADDSQESSDESECFDLLNALSDLLMLPKDMILDRTVRMEICPQISLPLVKRILCNFTPDEFCPDLVPGSVLEAFNAECITERRLLGDSAPSFPYSAAPVVYIPPSTANMTGKVAEEAGESQLSRSASAVQRKGYTSDEDLVELDCPLATVVEKSPTSPTSGVAVANARYELLREVWQAK